VGGRLGKWVRSRREAAPYDAGLDSELPKPVKRRLSEDGDQPTGEASALDAKPFGLKRPKVELEEAEAQPADTSAADQPIKSEFLDKYLLNNHLYVNALREEAEKVKS